MLLHRPDDTRTQYSPVAPEVSYVLIEFEVLWRTSYETLFNLGKVSLDHRNVSEDILRRINYWPAWADTH